MLQPRIALVAVLVGLAKCQCPHLAAKGGGSPSPAPAALTLQTTFVYRPHSQEDELFAELVIDQIKDIRTRLRTHAVTVDNENVRCDDESSHPHCGDYAALPHYHHMIVESTAAGASVYSLEAELNGQRKEKIEAAILDCLSRHSGRDLTPHSSPKAEKEVPFTRELTVEELAGMGRKEGKKRRPRPLAPLSPLLLDPLDNFVLQRRNGEGFEKTPHRLVEMTREIEMDDILAMGGHLFVLFWSKADSLSLHAFNLWAKASMLVDNDIARECIRAHVPCHIHTKFCQGLTSRDLHQVVAFSNGAKVATLSEMRDAQLYIDWINIIRHGPVRRLKGAKEIKEAKRGEVDEGKRSAVTIGVFPSDEDPSYRHYLMAADKLFGQYYLFATFKEGLPSISTYRWAEKTKRTSHVDDFDPYSIVSFIVHSSQPSIVSIVAGFSTDALLRDPRPLLLLVAPSSFDKSSLSHLSSTYSSSFIVAHLESGREEVAAILKSLLIPNPLEPQLILLDKTRVWHMEVEEGNSMEELHEWTEWRRTREPDLVLSPFGVHPLRLLQLSHANEVFGPQEVELPEDSSVFASLSTQMEALASLRTTDPTSSCPFMRNPVPSTEHDEL